jgi:hypothetical protein
MRAGFRLVLIGFALAVFSTSAPAQISEIYRGNDTGGIIPWSCENEVQAFEIASGFCAGHGKYARITSVQRMEGDYIAFTCLWRPDVARFQIPQARTRTSCYANARVPRRQSHHGFRD